MTTIRVLGCNGAIGRHGGTTALLIDDDMLIDAGTGVATLDEAALARIDHVFLTHAHLDHMAYLPLMIDAAAEARDQPLVVHASEATLGILHAHVFNDLVWPDFTRIPSADTPAVRFDTLEVGECVEIGGRVVTSLPARHTVPATGFAIDDGRGCIVFSGDTTSNPEFWTVVASLPRLRYVIVETAFPDAQIATARAARHYCPSLIAEDVRGVRLEAELLISHLKPPFGESILGELREELAGVRFRALVAGEVLAL
jgi:ribonuclease BN (tRNA processing enzyme)